MTETKIRLKSIEDVKSFVRTVSQFTADVDLVSDRYVIDAKSILGIFSVDLANPVTLRIEPDADAPVIKEALRDYIVEE